MSNQNKSDRTKAVLAVVGVLVMIVAAVFFGLKWMGKDPFENRQSRRNEQDSPPVITQKIPADTKPSIDFDNSQDLMAKRKAELGLDKGVDMIVRPGETIKIGDSLVSVDEVLDKIRLKTGAIDERDIGDAASARTARRLVKLPVALEKLKTLNEEYIELERQLADTATQLDPEKEKQIRKRLAEITSKAQTYQRYQDVLEELAQAQTMLDGAQGEQTATLSEKIDALKKEQASLEDLILTISGTKQDLDAYGIYVVKANDNIWNIHFQFLRDYFTHKGIILSPVADEPTSGGESSGVGRLLKFSETMVHIYNIREKELASDLHLIQPLSKIVVFNLARVFALLESLDYSEVSRIRFDGETLWLPARNE